MQLDAVGYTCLIHFYLSQGESNTAIEIFEKMKQEKIKPNKKTYHCFLVYYEKTNNREKTFEIYTEMTKSGIEPDRPAVGSLLQLLVNLGEIEEAKKVYQSQNVCKAKVQRKFLDIHALTPGAAYIAVLSYFDVYEGKGPVFVVTGIGNRSNLNDVFETRNYLMEKLGQHPRVTSCKIDRDNPGRLYLLLKPNDDVRL
jgi:pentatricopeptide repeat protein